MKFSIFSNYLKKLNNFFKAFIEDNTNSDLDAKLVTLNIGQVNLDENLSDNLLLNTENIQKIIFFIYFFLMNIITKVVKLLILMTKIVLFPLPIAKPLNSLLKIRLANIISCQELSIPIIKRNESPGLRKNTSINVLDKKGSIDNTPKDKNDNQFDFLNVSTQNIKIEGTKQIFEEIFPTISEEEIRRFQEFIKKVS